MKSHLLVQTPVYKARWERHSPKKYCPPIRIPEMESELLWSSVASNYIGLYPLDSYDPLTCAATCDSKPSCHTFNVFLERDPPMTTNCAKQTSTINNKCTLFGVPVSSQLAKNTGVYVGNFHIVLAGSTGEFSMTRD